jgi:hypothetical protein
MLGSTETEVPLTQADLDAQGATLTPLQTGSRGGWTHGHGVLLRCPACATFVRTDGCDSCQCGAIAVDLHAARIAVRGIDEQQVTVVRALPPGVLPN